MKHVILSICLAALPAAAQWRHFGPESPRFTGSFGAGFASPVNPVASRLDTGWNLNGGVGLSAGYVGVMLDAMYTDFGINHETLRRIGVPNGDQRYWAVTVDPVVHVNPRGPIDFYITGGGGIYSQITDFRAGYGNGGPFGTRGDLLYQDTIYKPGVNGGAGFAFNAGFHSNIKIFMEARFHHMFLHGSGASFIPVSVGVRF
jgi:hypothetical protein